jgi:Protein of unknown function (DUF3105)
MPVPAGGGPRRRLPRLPRILWMPLAGVAGVLGAVGLVAYLVIQAGQPPGESPGVKEEADDSADLPGAFVNLPEIYGDDRASHVTRDVDFVQDGNSNPPAGGPMWSNGRCPGDPDDATPFCGGAPLGVFRKPWEPETLNHNMEHGGVVIWYNTSHRGFLDELEDQILDRLRDGDPLVLTPYTEMEEETIALTSWSRIDKFAVSEFGQERVEEFLDAHVCRYNPEGAC